MSDNEMQEIVAKVLETLRLNSLTIDQLSHTGLLGGDDCLELNKGRKTSLADLKAYLEHNIERYLEVLKREDSHLPTDSNVFSAARTLLEIAKNSDLYKKIFIRKDQADYTLFLLRLFGGLEVGEAIDSMVAGKGIIADANGRMQLSRLEVRDSMTVQEMIFNRLTAMESDYPFSESGTIESVEKVDDITYRLPLRKRWENDFTGIGENDVVYGMVNNLASGRGEYYTTWLRVLNVNTVTNTITVVMYPDNEVPGGRNFPPEPLMILSHRGNPVNKERQGYWYISSREKCICMLDGVTKPILEENNYGVIIGRLKHLTLFDNLPINYLHSYVYCRGIAIQDLLRINYQGQVVRQERYRGEWESSIASGDDPYIITNEVVDIVYHIGCKWQCLVSNTVQEPRWNATDWAMIEGNSELDMKFVSSQGDVFLAKQASTVLTPFVYWGNNDISADISDVDWTWSRNTGNVSEDNEWIIAHANNGRILTLKYVDMGSNWSISRKAEFICTAYLRDGGGDVLERVINKVIA